jgi:hypothetical protein
LTQELIKGQTFLQMGYENIKKKGKAIPVTGGEGP